MESLAEKTSSFKSVLAERSQPYLLNSFIHFYLYAFSIAVNRVEGKFITPARFHLETCNRFQNKSRTSTVAPRFFTKSSIAEALLMWKLKRMEHRFNEWLYMSFSAGLGAYHTQRVKRYIKELPEMFAGYRDLTESRSVLFYGKDGREFYCEPEGISSAKRGKHPHGVICDDILRDPEVKLDISQLKKLEETFFNVVESMPKEQLHNIGTPQDEDDLFGALEKIPEYDCKRYCGELDSAKKISLWERMYPWDYLMKWKSRIGVKAYSKEILCTPVRSAEAFVTRNEYDAIVCDRLKNYDILSAPKLNNRTVVAGFDIGKKAHPSHLCVLALNRLGKLIQVHSKFLDQWNYQDQIAYLKEAIIKFGIDRLFYDNTRAEFEGFAERGELPGQMEAVSFTAKSKYSMASELDKKVTQKGILLLNDDRQKRQILSVDCDLNAPSNVEGHGDAFWSLTLALQALLDTQGIRVWDAESAG